MEDVFLEKMAQKSESVDITSMENAEDAVNECLSLLPRNEFPDRLMKTLFLIPRLLSKQPQEEENGLTERLCENIPAKFYLTLLGKPEVECQNLAASMLACLGRAQPDLMRRKMGQCLSMLTWSFLARNSAEENKGENGSQFGEDFWDILLILAEIVPDQKTFDTLTRALPKLHGIKGCETQALRVLQLLAAQKWTWGESNLNACLECFVDSLIRSEELSEKMEIAGNFAAVLRALSSGDVSSNFSTDWLTKLQPELDSLLKDKISTASKHAKEIRAGLFELLVAVFDQCGVDWMILNPKLAHLVQNCATIELKLMLVITEKDANLLTNCCAILEKMAILTQNDDFEGADQCGTLILDGVNSIIDFCDQSQNWRQFDPNVHLPIFRLICVIIALEPELVEHVSGFRKVVPFLGKTASRCGAGSRNFDDLDMVCQLLLPGLRELIHENMNPDLLTMIQGSDLPAIVVKYFEQLFINWVSFAKDGKQEAENGAIMDEKRRLICDVVTNVLFALKFNAVDGDIPDGVREFSQNLRSFCEKIFGRLPKVVDEKMAPTFLRLVEVDLATIGFFGHLTNPGAEGEKGENDDNNFGDLAQICRLIPAINPWDTESLKNEECRELWSVIFCSLKDIVSDFPAGREVVHRSGLDKFCEQILAQHFNMINNASGKASSGEDAAFSATVEFVKLWIQKSD